MILMSRESKIGLHAPWSKQRQGSLEASRDLRKRRGSGHDNSGAPGATARPHPDSNQSRPEQMGNAGRNLPKKMN